MVMNTAFHFLKWKFSCNFILLLFGSCWVYIFGYSSIFWVLSLISFSHQKFTSMKSLLFLNYEHIFLMHFEHTVLKLHNLCTFVSWMHSENFLKFTLYFFQMQWTHFKLFWKHITYVCVYMHISYKDNYHFPRNPTERKFLQSLNIISPGLHSNTYITLKGREKFYYNQNYKKSLFGEK